MISINILNFEVDEIPQLIVRIIKNLNKELYPDIKTNLLTVKIKNGYHKEALYKEIGTILKTGMVIQPSIR